MIAESDKTSEAGKPAGNEFGIEALRKMEAADLRALLLLRLAHIGLSSDTPTSVSAIREYFLRAEGESDSVLDMADFVSGG